ncbi:carbohydrate binding family 9 domain-containing protein [Flavobacteriales bacterium]|nr:carbohydrate binding family 9 domain-containing protein [Flavobacteriales bacterium]
MRIKNIFLLFTLLPLLTFGQFSDKKVYNIKKVQNPPKIDGNLSDRVWTKINIANNFSQISPNNGTPERQHQKTEVKICYDSKNIYFGVMMHDNAPDSILRELSRRDEENKNYDAFGIWLEPFNDSQVEYNFMVTAAGVQIDRKFSKTGIDKTWDAVWNSAVNINNNGWVVEFSIPFSQLRFPEENQSWAINMAREIRRYRETYSWNPIDVNYDDFALQAGLIEGIEDVNSPLRLSFMPYASVYADMYDGETTFPYNYGIDLKYGINESFTLDMTLIPDFGQVASDAMVLNLSPFEVKYEEKRQFFNEGTELFNKGEDMFYSRRLQDDLLNASKVTGRTKNGLGIAILNAVTNKTNEDPLTNYNVMIFDQAFGNSSSVSLMNTHMVQNGIGKDASVTGLFTRINNKKNTRVYVGKLKMSQEFEGSNLTKGFSGMLAVGKMNGNYKFDLYTIFEDDKYNPNDLGFLYSNNEITNGISLSYHQFNENKKFVNSNISTSINHQTLFTDQKFVNLELAASARITLKNYTTISIRTNINPYEKNDFYEARTGDLTHPLKRSKSIAGGGWFSTDYRKRLAIDIGAGGVLNPLYKGYGYNYRISPRWRINDNISLRYVLSIKNRYNDIGFVINDTSGLFIEPPQVDYIFAKRNTYMITNVLSTNYIVNNKIDLSVKLRYHMDQVKNLEFNALGNDGYLNKSNYIGEHNINYTTWTSDIAFNWWFAPGSQMSLVWKNAIDNQKNILINHWTDNVEESFSLAKQNSLSLKVIYYLDYLYLRK